MTIINQRWPRELCPESCRFGRSRNDILQGNVYTRKTRVIRRGRPLWEAECSWTLPNDERLAQLRYLLDGLEGFAGSVQIWDFTSPYPQGLKLATGDSEGARIWWTYNSVRAPWTFAGLPSHWTLGNTVAAAATCVAGATTISLTGLAPSTVAAVQGQYVQIGRRVYLVTTTATSDASGNVALQFAPPLLSQANPGDAVRLVEAGCEMQLASQKFDASSSAGAGFVSVSAAFIETVEDF